MTWSVWAPMPLGDYVVAGREGCADVVIHAPSFRDCADLACGLIRPPLTAILRFPALPCTFVRAVLACRSLGRQGAFRPLAGAPFLCPERSAVGDGERERVDRQAGGMVPAGTPHGSDGRVALAQPANCPSAVAAGEERRRVVAVAAGGTCAGQARARAWRPGIIRLTGSWLRPDDAESALCPRRPNARRCEPGFPGPDRPVPPARSRR